MAIVNDVGVQLTTLNEYVTSLQAEYRAIDPGWNIEPESPDGLAIAAWSEVLANLDEAVVAAYRSVDPATAIGLQLDRIALISGLERQPGTPSTVTLRFTGDSGFVIPAGTLVRNAETEDLWATDASAVLNNVGANLGFEDGITPIADDPNWSSASNDFVPVNEPARARTGDWALRKDIADGGGADASLSGFGSNSWENLEAGEPITFRFHVAGFDGGTCDAQANTIYGGVANEFGPVVAIPSTGEYQIVEFDSVVPAGATSVAIRLGITGHTAGSIYVDDVEIDAFGSTNPNTGTGEPATVVVQATAQEAGPIPAAAGDLSVIVNPVAELASVTNPASANPGRPEESDALLRARRANSVAAPGQNQVGTIFGDVANVEGVSAARVYENFTGAADLNGLAAHSIAIFALGGTQAAIAQAIANNKSPGVSLNAGGAFGASEVTVAATTAEGSPLTVTFFRPTSVDVFVAVEISAPVGTSIVAALKQAIVDYATAAFFEAGLSGFDPSGFRIGEVVAASKLYTPVNRLLGQNAHITSLLIGLSAGSESLTQIDPGFDGIATFNVNNITVTVA